MLPGPPQYTVPSFEHEIEVRLEISQDIKFFVFQDINFFVICCLRIQRRWFCATMVYSVFIL